VQVGQLRQRRPDQLQELDATAQHALLFVRSRVAPLHVYLHAKGFFFQLFGELCCRHFDVVEQSFVAVAGMFLRVVVLGLWRFTDDAYLAVCNQA